MKLIQSFNIPGPQGAATRFPRDRVAGFPCSSRRGDGREGGATCFPLRWRRGDGRDGAATDFPSRWWRCDGWRRRFSFALISPRADGAATAETAQQRTSPRAGGVLMASGDACPPFLVPGRRRVFARRRASLTLCGATMTGTARRRAPPCVDGAATSGATRRRASLAPLQRGRDFDGGA